MTTSVRRDPFARGELERRTYTSGRCAWCGAFANHPDMPETRGKRLYTYEWVSDGGRRFGESREFCNLQCWEAFQ